MRLIPHLQQQKKSDNILTVWINICCDIRKYRQSPNYERPTYIQLEVTNEPYKAYYIRNSRYVQ